MKKKISDRKIAIVDCETTGLSYKKHEIIEIAVILYDPKQDKIIQEWTKKIKPRNIKTANQRSLEINGFSQNQKEYTEDIKSVIKEYYKLTRGFIILGKNIKFDIKFIDKHMKEFKIKKKNYKPKTLELTDMVYPAICKSDLVSVSLHNICEYFEISNDGEHSALIDCRRTLEVFRCLMKNFQ